MKIAEIEKLRIKCVKSLSGKISDLMKLQILIRFFDRIGCEVKFDLLHSYYLEFSSSLFSLINEYSIIHSDPEYLLRISDLLKVYPSRFQDEVAQDRIAEAGRILGRVLIYTWFVLGEWKRGIEWLEKETGEVIGVEEKRELEEGLKDRRDSYERLLFVCAILKERHTSSYLICRGILDEWTESFRSPNPDRINLLLVEKSRMIDVANGQDGVILPMSVKVRMRPGDAEEDLIRFNNTLLSGEGEIIHGIRDAILAARSLLDVSHIKGISNKYFSFHFSLSVKSAGYSGDSWGGIIALLTYCGMVNAYYSQPLALLNSDSLVTSTIDLHGHLLPIGEAGLKAKVVTAFYSPSRRLVVPWKNLPSATKLLETLMQKHPNRHMILESSEDLGQLVEDRNLVQRKPLNIPRRMLTGFRRHKSKIGWIITGFLTIFIVLSLFLKGGIWIDRNPSAFDISGQYLIIKNVEGEELWRHDFGETLTKKNYIDTDHRNIVLKDIDHDGKSECIMGIFEERMTDLSGRVFLFDHDGQLEIEWKTGREMVFGEKVYPNHYRVALIDIIDIDNNGEWEIVTVSHHFPDFPCCVDFWSLDGKRLAEYWHSGQISGLYFIDFNRDGVKEVFALGQNNEYGCAVLTVFNALNMQGASPQKSGGPFCTKDFPTGREIFYLSFPHSDIHRLLGGRDIAYEILDHGELFQVAICNGKVSYTRDLQTRNILYFYLTLDFSVKNIIISDNYREKFIELTGKQVDIKSVEERLKKISFYDGENWIQTPTMTKYLREKLGK